MLFRTVDLNLATSIRASGRMRFVKASAWQGDKVEFCFDGPIGVGPEMEAEFKRHKKFLISRINTARGDGKRPLKSEKVEHVNFDVPAEWLS
jgi:hypothetical protein